MGLTVQNPIIIVCKRVVTKDQHAYAVVLQCMGLKSSAVFPEKKNYNSLYTFLAVKGNYSPSVEVGASLRPFLGRF